ncbi:hypothetical protein ACRE_057360 [Hapsidospora chrysogenum ATCC 11550]|uniref:Uncharacterized protein n=1 Tax=Hapsidospora chrysogenum (strain ATCC 11550 / CBS 779.69 / DSM 880 / IAM 14645 / JCM 23072 / IMI 49137) TaxID=857340 RepID=A0A086T2A4_HAPC1|nr:hypothetical protein ACRE_057360 [Hapsidospora chrysogenum ATCC 11550]
MYPYCGLLYTLIRLVLPPKAPPRYLLHSHGRLRLCPTPFEERPELWHPLETVLSDWMNLISIGKVIASPTDTPSLFGSQKVGPWEWVTYSEAQVAACVAAWDRLCDAIKARYVLLLPPDSATTVK